MDTRTSPIRLRIAHLREAMAEADVHAVLVPSADPHLSEYLPERWQAREWLSGFTGSMGTLVVAADTAVLFADSRYWTQAEAELAGTGIALEKIATGAALNHVDWLAPQVPPGATVAVDWPTEPLKEMLPAPVVRKTVPPSGPPRFRPLLPPPKLTVPAIVPPLPASVMLPFSAMKKPPRSPPPVRAVSCWPATDPPTPVSRMEPAPWVCMVPSDKMRMPLASPDVTPGMFEVTLPPVPVSEMVPPWLVIECGELP
jgi:hypothetical protein